RIHPLSLHAALPIFFVAIAVTGLLLLGLHPLGYENFGLDSGSSGSLSPLYAAFLVVNLVLAVITLLKGKIWTGLIGLFVPALLIDQKSTRLNSSHVK